MRSLSRPPLRRLVPVLLAVALLAPSAAVAAEGAPLPAIRQENAVAERQVALREQIRAQLGKPAVAALLYELETLASAGGSAEVVAGTFREVASSHRTGPEVRALALRLLADLERSRGNPAAADEHLQAIGVIREVALIGPFDDENKGGWDVAWGPERSLDLAERHRGLRDEVTWRVVEGLGSTGTLALHQAVRPTRHVLVYALAVLDAPAAGPATLYLGTPGAAKAWLNGKPILADPDYRPARFDQLSVPVRLQRGRNVLLLKLAAGASGPFELHARVVGAGGRPIPGLRIHAPTEGRFAAPEPIPAGRVIRGARPVVDALEKAAAGGAPEALWAHARVLGERHPFADTEKRHERAAKAAANAGPADVEAQLLAARWAEDANDRLHYLERAAAVSPPGDARAAAQMARFWLGRNDPVRAARLLDAPAAAAPGDWPSQLVLAEVLDAQGFQARASARVEALATRFPDEPRVLQTLARHRLRERRAAEAMELLEQVVRQRPADLDAAASLASILLDRGQVARAERLLAGAAALRQVDVLLLLRRADLLAANGRDEEAQRLYDEAAAIAPQEGEVFERAGQAALRAGDREVALARFQRSLEVRPQNAQLKELVRSLRPGEASFASPFLRDLREAAAAAAPHPGEDAVKLVELSAVRVMPSGQASRTVQRIVRVQNQRGVDRFRSNSIRYAPGRDELRIERARVLKPDGTIVDAHTEGDRSMNEPWSGLYYDTRSRVVGFPSLAPGDVLELVYRLDDVARDNLLGDYFGDIDFVEDTVPTERWEYVLEMPAGRRIHANELDFATYAEEALPGGGSLHRWVALDREKLEGEQNMPGWAEIANVLHVSTYPDWESVARFWWGLIKDQVQPTPEIERVAREIVAGIPEADVDARVRAVHEYVVRNTRYVGLEFGIHSFKPYKVEQVLRRRFGDCKDKASLTYALLRSIGIDSRLVLLRMRHLGRIAEAPASLAVFNHAILYVPALDLWLDGTAEWSGSRELPEADRGAEVLVVNPGGRSVFGRIPEAPAALSRTESAHRIELAWDGSASVDGQSRISGLPAPGYRRAYASPNGRKASFEQAWARTFPGVTVTRLEMSDPARIEEDVQIGFSLDVPEYAERMAGEKLAFRPLGDGRSWVETLAPTSARRHPLVLKHAWSNAFRYAYVLPDGYDVERLPAAGVVESPFGRASLGFTRGAAGELLVEATITLEVPRVEAAAYGEFRTFLGRVDELFSRRVVIAPAALEGD